MSRDVYSKSFYQDDSKNRPRPIKWMALESLREGLYSTASDVVSGGPFALILQTGFKRSNRNAPFDGVLNFESGLSRKRSSCFNGAKVEPLLSTDKKGRHCRKKLTNPYFCTELSLLRCAERCAFRFGCLKQTYDMSCCNFCEVAVQQPNFCTSLMVASNFHTWKTTS